MADLMQGEWQFLNTPTAPPANGQLRLNNATQPSATIMWIHKTSATNADSSAALLLLQKGAEVYLSDKDDPNKWQRYGISNNPTDRGTYMEFPVIWQRGGSPLAEQRILVLGQQGKAIIASPASYAMTGKIVSPRRGLKATAAAGVYATQGGRYAICQRGYADGLYAFPSDTDKGIQSGLTIRRWFAGQALNGLMSNSAAGNLPPEQLAVLSFGAADALMWLEGRERIRGKKVQSLMAAAVWPAGGANPKIAPPPQQAPATVTPEEVAAMQTAKPNGGQT